MRCGVALVAWTVSICGTLGPRRDALYSLSARDPGLMPTRDHGSPSVLRTRFPAPAPRSSIRASSRGRYEPCMKPNTSKRSAARRTGGGPAAPPREERVVVLRVTPSSAPSFVAKGCLRHSSNSASGIGRKRPLRGKSPGSGTSGAPLPPQRFDPSESARAQMPEPQESAARTQTATASPT